VESYRVYYQARGFVEGRVVTAKIWHPGGLIEDTGAFTELGDGLYQFDYCDLSSGRHVFLFREDGVKTRSQVLRFGVGA